MHKKANILEIKINDKHVKKKKHKYIKYENNNSTKASEYAKCFLKS